MIASTQMFSFLKEGRATILQIGHQRWSTYSARAACLLPLGGYRLATVRGWFFCNGRNARKLCTAFSVPKIWSMMLSVPWNCDAPPCSDRISTNKLCVAMPCRKALSLCRYCDFADCFNGTASSAACWRSSIASCHAPTKAQQLIAALALRPL